MDKHIRDILFLISICGPKKKEGHMTLDKLKGE